MGDDRGDAVSEQETLALYLLGALPDDERADFERHLAGCDRCTAEALDLGPLTSGLGGFTDAEIDAFLADAGADDPWSGTDEPWSGADRPRTGDPEPPPGPSAQDSPVVPRPRARTEASRPVDNRPGAPSRRRRPVLIAGAAAVLTIVAGLSLIFLRDTGTPADEGPALAAIAEAESSGVSLSVSVIETPEGQIARATVSGLQPGTRYRLYTAVRGGDTHVIADWIGETGVQEIDGRLPVPAGTLAFFSVYLADGGPIVTATITTGTPAPR